MTNARQNSSTADAVQQVGAALDRAERDYADSQRYSIKAQQWAWRDLARTRQAYLEARNTAWLARLAKLWDMASEKDDVETIEKLRAISAQAHKSFGTLPYTATHRQSIDAAMEVCRADGILEVVEHRWRLQMEKQRAERVRASHLKKEARLKAYRSRQKAAKQKSK